MDEIAVLVLIVLAVILTPIILAIIALRRTTQMRGDLENALQRIRALEGGGTVKQINQPVQKPQAAKEPKEEKKPPSPTKVAASTAVTPTVKSPPPPKPRDPNWMDHMVANIKENWVIWVAGVALALGGVFFVEYGIEAGYFPPAIRVLMAAAFGIALIVGAETIRRRGLKQEWGAFSPIAALAAGGIASLFGAVMGAHLLYDLIGPGLAMLGLGAIAFASIGGGIIYGVVVAVIGLLGAYILPFILSGDANPFLYLFFGTIFAASLLVERWQKWIWLSSLSAIGVLFWAVILHDSFGQLGFTALFLAVVLVLGIVLPAFNFPPRWHSSDWLNVKTFRAYGAHYPTIFAVLLTLATAILMVLSGIGPIVQWQIAVLVLLGLSVLALLLFQTENLDQIFGIMALACIATMFIGHEQAFRSIVINSDLDQSLTSFPKAPEPAKYFTFGVGVVLALMAMGALAVFWRANRSVRNWYWHGLAAVLPLASYTVLWALWQYAEVLSQPQWAAFAGLIALYGTALSFMTLRAGAVFGADLFAISASAAALLAIGIYIGFDAASYAIALAAIAGLGALARMQVGFVWLGRVSILYTGLAIGKLYFFPGIPWGQDTDWVSAIAIYGITPAILGAIWKLAKDAKSDDMLVVFETATLAAVASTVIVLLNRVFFGDVLGQGGYVAVAQYGVLFLILFYVQAYRRSHIKSFQNIRLGFSILWAVFAVLSALFVLQFGPLFMRTPVGGFFPFDQLIASYGFLTIAFGLPLIWSKTPVLFDKRANMVGAGLFGVLLFVSEIRYLWHGEFINLARGVRQPELYTYTIVMLVVTIAAFVQSIRKSDAKLRRLALIIAGVTAFKVFFWDMAELSGLGRATAFVALGLVFVGVAWLNKRFPVGQIQEK